MNKLYSRIKWENYPSEKTPLNESNLNKIDNAVDALDDRVIEIDTKKLDIMTANTMVKDVGLNPQDGVITVSYLNGAKATFDTNLEKIALNFTYDASTQKIVLTLSDGTEQYIDLSALITEYEFEESCTVAFEVIAGKVRAKVKNGSITSDMLRPDYLADITVQAQKALQGANDSGVQAEAALASAVRSEEAAKKAEDITGVSIATNDKAGIIKGNLDEFTVSADGKLSLTSSYTEQSELAAIVGEEDKKTLFGKIAKSVSSLISHIADKTIHHTLTNNLLATVAGTGLDAMQGKVLDDKVSEVNRKLITTETEISPGVILYRNGSNRNLQIKGAVSGTSGIFVTLGVQDTPTNHFIGAASYGDSTNAMIGLIRVSIGGNVQLLSASRSTVSGAITVGGVSWVVT